MVFASKETESLHSHSSCGTLMATAGWSRPCCPAVSAVGLCEQACVRGEMVKTMRSDAEKDSSTDASTFTCVKRAVLYTFRYHLLDQRDSSVCLPMLKELLHNFQ